MPVRTLLLALLHDGPVIGPDGVWSAWSGNTLVMVALVITGVAYAVGLRRMWARSHPGGGVSRGCAVAFAGGLGALAFALLSPVDSLGEFLLSAHMIQHLILILIAAPLIVAGMPATALLWSLPAGARRAAGQWWNHSRVVRPGVRACLHPAVIWFLAAGTLLTWHLPALYQAALGNSAVHAVEHLSFVATSIGFWWVVLQPSGHRRLPLGEAIPFVIAAGIVHAMLGALLTFSAFAWYPAQSRAASLWGLTPLEDQQLAGLIMWIPAAMVYLGVTAWLFLKWLDSRAREASPARAAGHVARSALVLVAAGAALTGCGDDEPLMEVPGGDAELGRTQLVQFGCAACHLIPGIRKARGTVGPSLAGFAERDFIAGAVPNTPEYLVSWIVMPQSIRPGGAMPNLGITDVQARNMAAYLYTLR
ncbi:MAG: cytochrome c oxidase assembly protein [Gemmatimonadales bacterium]